MLWLPPGEAPPQALVASLQRRSLPWVPVHDGYDALAEVLLRRRSLGRRGVVLVLVHPTRLDLAGLVVDALGRAQAGVAVWRFDPGLTPVLAVARRSELATVFVRSEHEARPWPGVPDRGHRSAPARPVPIASPHASTHAAAHALPSPHADDAAWRSQNTPSTPEPGRPPDDEPTAASLLTDEELRMLLADPSQD